MSILFIFIILFLKLSCIIGDNSLILYTDISSANTTDSLIKIRNAPLKYYEFLYDSVADRKQLGLLSSDAIKIFPESVDIVSQYNLPSKDKNKTIISLKNFPIVDKNKILIHGIAALQELIKRNENLSDLIYQIQNQNLNITNLYIEIDNLINNYVNNYIIEKEILINQKEELIKKEIELNELILLDEKEKNELKLNEEKSLYLYEEELLLKKQINEEKLLIDNLNYKLTLEKQIEEEKEKIRKNTLIDIENKRNEYNQMIEQKKIDLEKEKITIEINTKIQEELANEEITIRRMKLQSQLDSEKIIDIVKLLINQILIYITNIINNPIKILYIIIIMILLLIIYYIIIIILKYIKYFIDINIGKPKLIRESSYQLTIIFYIIQLINYLFYKKSDINTYKHIENIFSDVILSNDDKKRVIQLAIATRNTRMMKAPYRHVLLYGPPGTGKTLIARRLAMTSDMDYVILSGGDIVMLGNDAVNQLHNLFDWASRSKRGLLIFIDESEAFLSSRIQIKQDNIYLRHALNALLYQTGKQSNKFMLILATNRPEDLDSAVLDRIDISISIGLPGINERKEILKYYLNKYIKNTFNDDNLLDISNQINGFSGREISKLCIAIQHSLQLNNNINNNLSIELINNIVKDKIIEHKQKENFIHKQINKNIINTPINGNKRIYPISMISPGNDNN